MTMQRHQGNQSVALMANANVNGHHLTSLTTNGGDLLHYGDGLSGMYGADSYNQTGIAQLQSECSALQAQVQRLQRLVESLQK